GAGDDRKLLPHPARRLAHEVRTDRTAEEGDAWVRLEAALVAAQPVATHRHVVVGPDQVFTRGRRYAGIPRMRDARARLQHTAHRQAVAKARVHLLRVVVAAVDDDDDLPGRARRLGLRERGERPRQRGGAVARGNDYAVLHASAAYPRKRDGGEGGI